MAESNSRSPNQILERCRRRAAKAKVRAEQQKPPKKARVESRLKPERRTNYFIADISGVAPKDDSASMEHPLFALRAGDKRARHYGRNGNSVTVLPGYTGCATIHDKDLWIYCISQLVEAQNRGREITPIVRFTMYDFLKATNRRTDGDSYQRAAAMLARLKGTVIETNIKTGGQRERGFFGLIDSARVVERSQDNDRMVAVEVEMPGWVFRSVQAKEVLTLHRDYFRLRKPLDRRIYELARKHCGKQRRWRVGVATLHEKSGSTATLRKFRAAIKALAKSGELPSFRMVFEAQADAMTFYAKGEKGALTQMKDTLKKRKR